MQRFFRARTRSTDLDHVHLVLYTTYLNTGIPQAGLAAVTSQSSSSEVQNPRNTKGSLFMNIYSSARGDICWRPTYITYYFFCCELLNLGVRADGPSSRNTARALRKEITREKRRSRHTTNSATAHIQGIRYYYCCIHAHEVNGQTIHIHTYMYTYRTRSLIQILVPGTRHSSG